MDKKCENIVSYLSMNEEDFVKNEYIKKQKTDKINVFLSTFNMSTKEVFIDEDFRKSVWEKPEIKKVLNKIENGEVSTFITTNLFDLGNDFIANIDFIKYLIKNNIRLICIDNNLDTDMFFNVNTASPCAL